MVSLKVTTKRQGTLPVALCDELGVGSPRPHRGGTPRDRRRDRVGPARLVARLVMVRGREKYGRGEAHRWRDVRRASSEGGQAPSALIPPSSNRLVVGILEVRAAAARRRLERAVERGEPNERLVTIDGRRVIVVASRPPSLSSAVREFAAGIRLANQIESDT